MSNSPLPMNTAALAIYSSPYDGYFCNDKWIEH